MTTRRLLSVRAYAVEIGYSHTGVNKAIRSGKIKKALVYEDGKSNPKIDVDLANKEWASQFVFERSKNRKILEVGDVQSASEPGKDQRKADTVSDIADTDLASGIIDAPLLAIQKKKMTYEAEIKKLEYRKLKAELVQRDDVYKAMFDYGREIRSSIQAIPDRVIADIRAAKSDAAAHLLLVNAINDALESLSNTKEIK